MKIITATLLLLIALPASAVDWKTPTFVGDCYAWDTRRDAVRLIAFVMGLPQSQVSNTVIFCDPWTPFAGMSWREIAARRMGCTDRRYWTWHIGCATGLASGYRPGPVLLLHIHPRVADTLIAAAQQQGMSSGSRTWDQIRCFWTLSHFVRLTIHEFNHTKGYRHGTAMNAEDGRVFRLFQARYPDFIARYEWQDCQQRRRFRDDAAQDRIQP